MYKGIKKEQFTAREVAAAISAISYYLDGVTFITEHETRQFLHAFLLATIAARGTCRERNRRLDSTRAEAETLLVSDDLERRGREVEVDEPKWDDVDMMEDPGDDLPEPGEWLDTVPGGIFKEIGDAIAAVDAGVDELPNDEDSEGADDER